MKNIILLSVLLSLVLWLLLPHHAWQWRSDVILGLLAVAGLLGLGYSEYRQGAVAAFREKARQNLNFLRIHSEF